MSITENPLFIELFGKSETKSTQSTAEQVRPESKPIKENEHDNIYLYQPEVLKQKLSDFLLKLKQCGASYSVRHTITKRKVYEPLEVKSFVDVYCENKIFQADLLNEINNDAELKALLIINFAQNDKDTDDIIFGYAVVHTYGRACYDEYYSGSLFIAVFSQFQKINELPSHERIEPEKFRANFDKELKYYCSD